MTDSHVLRLQAISDTYHYPGEFIMRDWAEKKNFTATLNQWLEPHWQLSLWHVSVDGGTFLKVKRGAAAAADRRGAKQRVPSH